MSERSGTRDGAFYAGIDAGSWTTKAAILNGAGTVRATAIVRTAADLVGAAEGAYALALERAGIARGDVDILCATGFGRHAIPFAGMNRTELDAHARGVSLFCPGPLTVVDIGGQDAKMIRLDAANKRVSHRMNRKCASGTGSFLDEIALRLDVRVDDLPAVAAGSTEELELGSFCTVFAGTELLAAIRQGKKASDLVRAAYRSVVKRVLEMERIDGKVVATGGVVAHHPMIVTLMREVLKVEVQVPPYPQEIGAIGAAIAARVFDSGQEDSSES
jgi:predicted CoA-substrate-specific enzyme activase